MEMYKPLETKYKKIETNESLWMPIYLVQLMISDMRRFFSNKHEVKHIWLRFKCQKSFLEIYYDVQNPRRVAYLIDISCILSRIKVR